MKLKKPSSLPRAAHYISAYLVIVTFAITGVILLVRSQALPATVTVEGEFIHSYVDYENGSEAEIFSVKDSAGIYNRMDFSSLPSSAKKLPRTGSKVRISGYWEENTLKAAATTSSVTVIEDAADDQAHAQLDAAAPVSYRRAIILVNLNGATGARAVIPVAEQQRLLDLPTGPDKYWGATSYGNVAMTSTVLPIVNINVSDIPNCTDSTVYTWADRADAALAAQGVSLANYTHRAYMLPVTSCGWSGLGNIKGPRSWLSYGYAAARSDNEMNGTSAHEFGHNVGLQHASSYRCTEAGVAVQISASCTASTYGDVFDVMGNSGDRNFMGRLLAAYQRVQLGYIPTAKVQTITASGNYRLASVNIAPDQTTAPQSLRIARVGTTQSYDLEYRSPYSAALDNFAATDPVVNGVTVRLVPSAIGASTSPLLLDSTPTTTSYLDAPSVATPFADTASKVTFKVVSRTATEVVVAVTINGVAPPTTPPPLPSDTTPPTVSISSPASGASFQVGAAINVAATAADNVAVTKVEFYNGTTLLGTDTTSPYSFAWNTAGQTAGNKSVTARAYDAAGNTGVSASVSIVMTSPTSNTPGDVNGDGKINAIDLSALISHDGQNYAPADFNKDGTVGAADMAILLSRWTW